MKEPIIVYSFYVLILSVAQCQPAFTNDAPVLSLFMWHSAICWTDCGSVGSSLIKHEFNAAQSSIHFQSVTNIKDTNVSFLFVLGLFLQMQ